MTAANVTAGTCVRLTCRGRGSKWGVGGRRGIAPFWRFTSAIIVRNTDVDGHAQMLLKLYNYLQSAKRKRKKEKRIQFIMRYFNRRYRLLRFW